MTALSTLLPTRRLALVVAVAGPVWLLSGDAAWPPVAALVLILFALAYDLGTLPPPRVVHLGRELPPTAGLGDPIPGRWRVRSDWGRPLVAELYDRLPRELMRNGARAVLLHVPPAGAIEAPFLLTARARGLHDLGPVAVRVRGALGLLGRTIRAEPGDRITIAPSMAGVSRYRLMALQHRLVDLGIRSVRRRGESTSFDRLREYVRGDDPRHIDWKATVRRRELVTREFTVEQGQTVVLVVDAGRMMTQLAEGVPRFEHALAAALVLADVAVSGGDRVGLLVFDDAIRAWVPPSRGLEAIRKIRGALITVRPRFVEPDYAGAFRYLAANQRKRALVAVFTDLVDVRGSESLIAHLARLARRHLPIVAALRNEELVGVADAVDARSGAPAAAPDPWRQAAAEELLAERETAMVALRRSGAAVLDVPPGRLTAAVVNRYLEVKSRATL